MRRPRPAGETGGAGRLGDARDGAEVAGVLDAVEEEVDAAGATGKRGHSAARQVGDGQGALRRVGVRQRREEPGSTSSTSHRALASEPPRLRSRRQLGGHQQRVERQLRRPAPRPPGAVLRAAALSPLLRRSCLIFFIFAFWRLTIMPADLRAFWERFQTGIEIAVGSSASHKLLGVRDGFLRYFHEGLHRSIPVVIVPHGEVEVQPCLPITDEEAISAARRETAQMQRRARRRLPLLRRQRGRPAQHRRRRQDPLLRAHLDGDPGARRRGVGRQRLDPAPRRHHRRRRRRQRPGHHARPPPRAAA